MPVNASYRLPILALFGAAALVACTSGARDAADPVARAQAHLAAGNADSATSTLEAGGARDALDPATACLLGRLYRERGTIQGRLLSQEILEAARARHPQDLDVSMELATTYFAQGFYPDAVRGFREVLEREPARCDARTLLGLYHYRSWKRMNEYRDDLGVARRELRAAFSCDPGNAEIALCALVAGYALGDSIAGECDSLVARFSSRSEFRLMRGSLAFEAARYEACASDYAAAFALMDDTSRAVFESLTHVLGAHDDARFRSATAEVQEDFQRGLWLVADPDPTTVVNPRALEHVYRLFIADCLYSNHPTGKRGWETDRGEAFVRFGRPIDIDYNMGEGFINGKVETWSFATDGLFHQLVFVDEYLNGNPRIPYAADLTLHFMRHFPAATTLPPDATEIPAFVDAYAFRDDDMTGSIYLAMAIDTEALREVVDLSKVDRFLVRAAYFDEVWAREGGISDSVRASDLHETRSTRGRAFEVVRRLRVPCDRYHVAMAFEDPFGLARAAGRRDVSAVRFAGDGLCVSDVLLFREEGPARRGGADDTAIERGGRRMRPNVERQYREGERLRAYVEIYNLALVTDAATRVSRYDLRYAIFSARAESDPAWVDWGRRAVEWAGFGDDDEAVISQTFRREGRAHDDRETIAIDIDALDDGRYQLLVEVTDQRSGQRAVAHAPFWKEAATGGRAD